MNKKLMKKPLYAKAHSFLKNFSAALKKMNSEDIEFMKDDINIAMFRMRDAIGQAYGEDDKMMTWSCFGYARGKTGALAAYLDILSGMEDIKLGDAVELSTTLEEINKELTALMKQIKPDTDKWKEEFFEEFGEKPEDLDKIRGEDDLPPPDDR
jgi:hypothetical protein